MGRGAGAIETTTAGTRSPLGRTARRPYKWTDRAIERWLQDFVAESGRLPTSGELQRDGLGGLNKAIARRGIAFWSEWLEVPLSAGQDRSPYGLADAIAEAHLVLRRRGRLPGPDRLRDLGYPRLAGFVRKRGGVKQFCADHGVPRTLP